MTNKDLVKQQVIKDLVEGVIGGSQASTKLGLTVRQVKRLKKAYLKEGIQGLLHHARGKVSNRCIKAEIKTMAVTHIKQLYSDFKPTFATEQLSKRHDIHLSSETVRQLMIEADIWKVHSRKHNGEYRTWRPRKDYFGEMQQFDGSYHKWFEARGEEICLLASIDDASGKITRARFAANEGVLEVFTFWYGYVQEIGIPVSIYVDKYCTYKINHKSAVDNHELMTQFQRACRQLGTTLITAHSPQAKGRVERLFQTLQDRLVKELRLAGISTIEAANQFLDEVFIPAFNAQFAVQTAKDGDVHKELSKTQITPHTSTHSLNSIFSIHCERSIARDFTIRFKNKYLQLAEKQPTTVFKNDTVIVEEHRDNTLKIRLREHYLHFTTLPEKPKKITIKAVALTRNKSNWIPPKDHPWRSGLV